MSYKPSLQHCILCGTCTCIPEDEILIENQGMVGDRDFIFEDQVTWLKRIRLVIGIAASGEQYPGATTQDAYITGSVRYRPRHNASEMRLQFMRGTAIEFNFGPGMKSLGGEEQTELISVPYDSLSNSSTRRHHCFAAIHESCVLILSRAECSQGQEKRFEPFPMEPRLLDQLVRRITKVDLIHCGWSSGWIPDPEEYIVHKAPKSYFCDPHSQLHIARLRPILGIYRGPTLAHDKFNSHLDQWQRALLLAPKTYNGDPFFPLPTEILMHIMSFLSARETMMFCYASNSTSWKLNQAGLWLSRLKVDMPWLWDITTDRILDELALVSGSQSADTIDWQAIYFDLREQSIYESRKRNLSLVNRRRIWNICLEMVQKKRLNELTSQVAQL